MRIRVPDHAPGRQQRRATKQQGGPRVPHVLFSLSALRMAMASAPGPSAVFVALNFKTVNHKRTPEPCFSGPPAVAASVPAREMCLGHVLYADGRMALDTVG